MTQQTIRLLEAETDRRGDLFARLVGDLFLALGYEDLRFNIQKSGREIDIFATHRTEPRVLRAECKATKAPIGGDQLNKFAGALDAERRLKRLSNLEVTGYFVSLNGFTETAREQELETGRGIVLLNGNQVIQELVNGRILVSIESALERAGRCAAGLSLIQSVNHYELLAHEIGWVWAVYYARNKEITHFSLIHADGEALAASLANAIIESDRSMGGRLHSLTYLAPDSEPFTGESDMSEAVGHYFQYLLSECGEIQLEGLPADQEVGLRRLNLENIFVPLYLDSSGIDSPQLQGRQPVGEVLAQHSRLSILALPGGGKSTLLKRLAVAYAFPERRRLVDDHLPDRPWLPLFFRCRHLGILSKGTIREILAGIPVRAELSEKLSQAFNLVVNRALQNGHCLLLVDGLDEISEEGDRLSFVNQLRTFLATYPAVQVVITSREVGFRLVGGVLSSVCIQYKLSEFNQDDIKRLTLAWHKEVVGDRPDVRADAERLAIDIWKSDRVRQLAKNPLLLTTLLLVKRWVGQLPNRRSVLYGKAIEVLLMTWNVEAHRPIEQDEAIPQLAFLAFSMMQNGVQDISVKKLRQFLNAARHQMPEVLAYAKTSVGDFINRVEFRSSILILSGNRIEDGTIYPVYEFRHLTFQEYLAARAIVEGYYADRKESDTLLSVTLPFISNPRWKEVIPLAAVLAGRKVQPLIEHLIRTTQEASPGQHPEVVLGQCIIDEVQIPPDTLEAALNAIVEHEGPVGSLTVPILKGKYGTVLAQLVRKRYFESLENWKRIGHLFALIVFDRFGWLGALRINEAFAAQVKSLLHSEDFLQKAEGALAIMGVAKSLKIPGAWPMLSSEAKRILEEMAREMIPCLFSDYSPLHFAASWALSSLLDIRIKFTLNVEVIKRLLELWEKAEAIQARTMAEEVIAKIHVEYSQLSDNESAQVELIKTKHQSASNGWHR